MLFKTTEEIKEFISVNHNFELTDIMPSIRQACNKYIIPAIGLPFFNQLAEAYRLDNASIPEDLAIQAIQEALAHYSYFLYAPIGFVQIGNNGIQEATSQNSGPARQWVTYDLKVALLESGDVALDACLQFLETNAAAYPAWQASEAYTRSKESFLNSADAISEYINIQNSRRTFLAMRPFIRKAERHYLTNLLGNELLEELKEQIKTNTLSAENKKVVKLIEPALAQLALHKAIPELAMKVSADGIKVQSFSNGIIKKDTASDTYLSALSRTLEVDGNADLQALTTYLIANAEAIPLFKNSEVYIARQPASSCSTFNKNSKIFVV